MPSHLRAALGGRPIGVHLPLGTGMVKAADRADEIGAAALQVFADNPTAWRRRADPPKELPAFRARLAALELGPTATHAAYLINLAGSDEAFWARSVGVLAAELRMGAAYGAAFVNVHSGSHRGDGAEAGIDRLARGLAAALAEAAATEPAADTTPPLLVLENSAGGGDGIGSTVEELAAIAEAAARAGVPEGRLGFCLDTAHLWGAGYDLSDPQVLDDLLERFDALLGPSRLAMLHLNDSKVALGSHGDRHQHLGAGMIGERGMRALLVHPRLAAVPAYLETPGMEDGWDARNMERVRGLIAGEALPRLEAADLDLPGSRARRERVAPALEGA
ncbi:MAG TPA: deoxyribonuclease IV [Candidatus Sulfotelmatobacter sp.]|nr:deoxyribonuclease IV [Candidatus Sulfotelmatobacter sp.]